MEEKIPGFIYSQKALMSSAWWRFERLKNKQTNNSPPPQPEKSA